MLGESARLSGGGLSRYLEIRSVLARHALGLVFRRILANESLVKAHREREYEERQVYLERIGSGGRSIVGGIVSYCGFCRFAG